MLSLARITAGMVVQKVWASSLRFVIYYTDLQNKTGELAIPKERSDQKQGGGSKAGNAHFIARTRLLLSQDHTAVLASCLARPIRTARMRGLVSKGHFAGARHLFWRLGPP